jgi:hypothetical protein
MKYARIVNNKVYETFVPHSGGTIEQYFTPEIVAQFIECPEEVENTWTYENGEFTKPLELIDVIDAESIIISEETITE